MKHICPQRMNTRLFYRFFMKNIIDFILLNSKPLINYVSSETQFWNKK